MGKFVRAVVLASTPVISDVDVKRENQLINTNLFVGFLTLQKVKALENGSDVAGIQVSKFYEVSGATMK